MIHLTRQERLALLTLACIMLSGTLLHYTVKTNPRLLCLINVVDSERIYPRVNLNTATYEELIRVPYIGPATAQHIIDFRRENGPFADVAHIKRIYGIGESRYKILKKYLTVSASRP